MTPNANAYCCTPDRRGLPWPWAIARADYGCNAVDARVRSACTGDYLAYCSQHDPDGKGVRRCMRSNGHKLSSSLLQRAGRRRRGLQEGSPAPVGLREMSHGFRRADA